MRLIKNFPKAQKEEVKSKLATGVVNLTHLSQVAKAVRSMPEARSCDDKMKLISSVENTSARDCEKKLIEMGAPASFKNEVLRVSSQNSYRLAINLDEEAKSLLEKFIDLTAHQNPFASKEAAFKMALKIAVKEIEKKRMGKERQSSETEAPITKIATVSVVDAKPFKSGSAPKSRYIPAALRRSVWQRDQGICRYVDPITGRSCRSTHSLQIDHILEFERGGSHSPQNLRLLCAQHNRFRNRGGSLSSNR
jgi:hypothetical protein